MKGTQTWVKNKEFSPRLYGGLEVKLENLAKTCNGYEPRQKSRSIAPSLVRKCILVMQNPSLTMCTCLWLLHILKWPKVFCTKRATFSRAVGPVRALFSCTGLLNQIVSVLVQQNTFYFWWMPMLCQEEWHTTHHHCGISSGSQWASKTFRPDFQLVNQGLKERQWIPMAQDCWLMGNSTHTPQTGRTPWQTEP